MYANYLPSQNTFTLGSQPSGKAGRISEQWQRLELKKNKNSQENDNFK